MKRGVSPFFVLLILGDLLFAGCGYAADPPPRNEYLEAEDAFDGAAAEANRPSRNEYLQLYEASRATAAKKEQDRLAQAHLDQLMKDAMDALWARDTNRSAGVAAGLASRGGVPDAMLQPVTGLPDSLNPPVLTGGPGMKPANPRDAAWQSRTTAGGAVLSWAGTKWSEREGNKAVEEAAKAALVGKAAGTVAVVVRQTVEFDSSTPARDSLLSVPGFRVGYVETGATTAEATAAVQASLARPSFEEPHTMVTANQTTVYSLGADGTLNGGTVVATSKGAYPAFAVPVAPGSLPSGRSSNGGHFDHGMFTAPMTPGLPRDVGLTGKDRYGKSTGDGVVSRGGNWTGPDHPSDAATHTASRDSSGGQDKT